MSRRLGPVVLILIVAAGMRFTAIDTQSLWSDEGITATLTRRTPTEIVQGTAADIHPPAYYLVTAGWQRLAGGSVMALRGLSAFFGVLTVALTYAIGKRLFSRWAGLTAALLVALSPFQVYYGQEVRMYAMLAAVSAAAVWVVGVLLREEHSTPKSPPRSRRGDLPSSRGRMIPPLGQAASGCRSGGGDHRSLGVRLIGAAPTLLALILLNALGLYTHYSYPFVMVAQSLAFLVWWARRPDKLRTMAIWIGVNLMALVLYGPWIPIEIRQVTTWPQGIQQTATWQQFVTTVAYGVTLPAERLALIGAAALALLAGIGLKGVKPHHAVLIGGWLVVPPLMLALGGATTMPFLKFLLTANIALMLLVGRGVVQADRFERVPRAAAVAITAVVVVIALLPGTRSLANLYTDPTYARDDYRAIARQIEMEAGRDAGVVMVSSAQQGAFSYYYPLGENVAPLPDADTRATLDRLLTAYNRIYALYYGADHESVERTLAEEAFPAQTAWFGDVRLVTYAAPETPAEAPQVEVGAQFGQAVRLVGYTLDVAGDEMGITLFWQAAQPLDVRYKVFVHVIDPAGDTIVAQHDSEPVAGFFPTTFWPADQLIADNHGLFLPDGGPYQVAVGMYSDDRLPITVESAVIGDRLFLQEVTAAGD